MELDPRTLALIAVGASVSANCQPCLERNASTAQRCGADPRQIAEAIDIGRRVRRGAASKMDEFALKLDESAPIAIERMTGDCGCDA